MLRHRIGIETRKYLSNIDFLEIETPYLIKSTPEGARDFVVPSRMNPTEFYALPQSPQTFKQLLMVSGYDRYFQIVKCFRDEDLRADRQPEFTQIDCEMAFVDQEEIIKTFEGLVKHLFKTEKNISFDSEFPRITYQDAMYRFGSDKPDMRFGMEFNYIKDLTTGFNFKVFDDAETVIAITIKGAADYSRKQLDGLTNWVKRPQIGAKGLIYVKCNEDDSFKSSADKFFNQDCLSKWSNHCNAVKGDLILILSGNINTTQKQMNELRLKLGKDRGLYKSNEYKPVWVVDFPLFEKDEETGNYHAMHHPFTSPKIEDQSLLNKNPEKVRANAYDLAINGVEVGGGSIRIHDKNLQEEIFSCLGFTKEEAKSQFGFLLNAFEYGAPPHGGIAFGFDRLCALMGNQDSIRDFIAFPKNNSGRDTMIDAPSALNKEQKEELRIELKN
jgi:aspartyl-tRNA synthetase